MKVDESTEHVISANEINRFMYCPHQWYYKRIYGHKVLQEKYKALHKKESNHEYYYTKGTKYHQQYYRKYRLKKFLQMTFLMMVLASLIRVIFL